MPNSHSCSRGKVWRRAHRQSGKRIPGACVKKSKSIKSRSVRKMKKSKSLKMRKSKKSKRRSARKSKSRSGRKMKKSKSKSRSKSRSKKSKSRKYHGFLDDAIKSVKGAVNKLTGAATSTAQRAIKGVGDAARFEGVTGYHRMFKGLPQKPYWMN